LPLDLIRLISWKSLLEGVPSAISSRSPGALSQHFAKEHTFTAPGLFVAEMMIDGDVPRHFLVSISAKLANAQAPGLCFGMIHEQPADFAILVGRSDSKIFDHDVVVGCDQFQEADDLPSILRHPDLMNRDQFIVDSCFP
jgi:hypothetical protein